jgi:hypothetical protein
MSKTWTLTKTSALLVSGWRAGVWFIAVFFAMFLKGSIIGAKEKSKDTLYFTTRGGPQIMISKILLLTFTVALYFQQTPQAFAQVDTTAVEAEEALADSEAALADAKEAKRRAEEEKKKTRQTKRNCRSLNSKSQRSRSSS